MLEPAGSIYPGDPLISVGVPRGTSAPPSSTLGTSGSTTRGLCPGRIKTGLLRSHNPGPRGATRLSRLLGLVLPTTPLSSLLTWICPSQLPLWPSQSFLGMPLGHPQPSFLEFLYPPGSSSPFFALSFQAFTPPASPSVSLSAFSLLPEHAPAVFPAAF